jgi:hypothetical protein
MMLKQKEWNDLKVTASQAKPIKSTHKLLHEYAGVYENALADPKATWHIPILEAWPMIQKLVHALRRIEDKTRIESEVDPDFEEICQDVNDMAQEALK